MSLDEVVTFAETALAAAPAPIPKELRTMLSSVIYRCAGVPEAYEHPGWLALRDRISAPGVDMLLDMLGKVIPNVAALADEACNPEIDQALEELCGLPELVLSMGRNGPLPYPAVREMVERVQQQMKTALEAYRRGLP